MDKDDHDIGTRDAAGPAGPLEPGRVVAGRYRVEARLGSGGMGFVYRARHELLGRTVALKVLLPRLATDAEVVERFLREARAAAAIGHPNIVEVFDLGTDAGVVFLTMEKLDGEDLDQRLQKVGKLAPGAAARIGVEIADAIGAAHEHGIVHRDLKPQNVFLARRGRALDVVKVLDFGIAKLLGHAEMVPLTRSGQVFGTPLYMAPEQLLDPGGVDHRIDVYAIGAVVYQALSGKPVYDALSYPELVLRISTESPPSLDGIVPGLPRGLSQVVDKALARAPADRYPSASALRDALAPFADLSATPAPGQLVSREPTPQSVELAATTPVLTSSAPDRPATTPWVSVSKTPPPPLSLPSLPPRRRRAPAIIAVAAAAVALGITGALIFAPGPSSEPARHAAPPRPEPPAPAPLAPASRTLSFSTTPPGAEVRVEGRTLCRTPCSAELPEHAANVTLRLEGHEDLLVALAAPLPPALDRALTRLPAPAPPPPRASSPRRPGKNRLPALLDR